jgi:methionyl-tRNA formyltransferase
MDIILCGYHWTGCEALRYLRAMGHRVFVFTHESPFHVPSLIEYCRKTCTPFSLENVSKAVLPFRPDAVVSIYYRFIIKRCVIDACGGRIMNLHPSLLPAYRGCSSLTWAMIDDRSEVGFTYHLIDDGCDTGDVLLQEKIDVKPFDTQATLYQRVCFSAMNAFEEAFQKLVSDPVGRKQSGEVSHYPRGCPHDGEIDPTWSDEQVERFIRAMINPPYPPAKLAGRLVHTMEEYHSVKQEMFSAGRATD